MVSRGVFRAPVVCIYNAGCLDLQCQPSGLTMPADLWFGEESSKIGKGWEEKGEREKRVQRGKP